MPERHLFEYAVIRLVPRVEREEFINIGVVLYCKKMKFLAVKFVLDQCRIKALAKEFDNELLLRNIHSFEQISLGNKDFGSIASLDMASRFRWLTATRSTILQSSKVHPGLCISPETALQKILEEQVL